MATTSSPLFVSWWITLAALVVDDAVKRTTAHNGGDRLTAACLLWLIASLQTTAGVVSWWVHIVFGSLVMSLHPQMKTSYSASCREKRRRASPATSWSTTNENTPPSTSRQGRHSPSLILKTIVESVPLAAWLALTTELLFSWASSSSSPTTTTVGPLQQATFGSFCLGWTMIALWRLQSRRRRPSSKSHHFIVSSPTLATTASATTSSSDVGGLLDESRWFEWTPRQVLDWIYQQKLGDNDGDIIAFQALLEQEHLEGHQLPRLALVDWRSFGLSTGMALELLDLIQSLTRRYSPPSNASTVEQLPQQNGTYPMNGGWLEELDREHAAANQEGSLLSHRHPSTSSQYALPEEQMDANEEKAKAILKNRYGFELPTLRRPGGDEQSTPSSASMDTSTSTAMSTAPPAGTPAALYATAAASSPSIPPEPGSYPAAYSSSATSSSNNSSIRSAPAMVGQLDTAKLPPHIADIVRRKPHLVQTVLQQRQSEAGDLQNNAQRQPQQQESSTAAFSSLPPTSRWRNNRRAENYHHAETGSSSSPPLMAVDEVEDDEYTELLTSRHHTISTEYKSIHK